MSRRAVFALATLLAVALGSVLGAAAFNLRRVGREKPAYGDSSQPPAQASAPLAAGVQPAPPPAAGAPVARPPMARNVPRREADNPAPVDAQGALSSSSTEPDMMQRLRGMEGSDPPLTLQLAREGNARFPDSPDAAERSWMIAKSLVDMHRLREAHEEAQSMVSRYPGTSWAQDVQRHLLSNPLD